MKNHWFSLLFLKISFLTKMASQEASWSQLGANLGPQELQNGPQEAAKTGSKIDLKNDRFLDRFLRVPRGAQRESTWGGRGKNPLFGGQILARLPIRKLRVGTED